MTREHQGCIDSCGADVRILLIGLGSRGVGDFFPALLSDDCGRFRIAAACDNVPERAAEFECLLSQAGVRSQVIVETDVAAIPRDTYDLSLIATSHDQHGQLIRDLIATGKPILKEKPAARSLQEAYALFANSPPIRVLTDRTYLETSLLVTSLIADIGPLRTFAAVSSLPSPDYMTTWRNDRSRAGGGALIDLGYHLVDLSVRLLGSPMRVSARERHSPRPGYNVEEDVEMQLECERGLARLRANRLGLCRHESFMVAGEHGSIYWSTDLVQLRKRSHAYTWRFDDTVVKRLRRMLSHEVPLALKGKTNLQHALIVQGAIDCLYRSLIDGEQVGIGLPTLEIQEAS